VALSAASFGARILQLISELIFEPCRASEAFSRRKANRRHHGFVLALIADLFGGNGVRGRGC
jgi:hypothetical protein